MKRKSVAGTVASAHPAEEASRITEELAATAVPASPPLECAEASRFFEQQIERLSGVLQVERWGEERAGSPVYHIYLRPDDRATEDAVYEAHGQVYDRYPGAYLEVVVLETDDPAPLCAETSA